MTTNSDPTQPENQFDLAARIQALEAEVVVKQNNYDMAIQALGLVRHERDEARRWAIHFKRKYLWILED